MLRLDPYRFAAPAPPPPPPPAFEDITLVASTGASVAAGTGTTTINLPATIEGDLWLAKLANSNDLTLGPDGIVGQGWTIIDMPSSAAPGSQLLYKFMGAVPDVSVVVDRQASIQTAVALQAWRGVDPGSTLDMAFTVASGLSNAPNSPANTTVTPKARLFSAFAIENVNSEASFTPPAGYGDAFVQGAGTAAASAGFASKVIDTPGTEDPGAWALSGPDDWRAYTFALRPKTIQGGGPPPPPANLPPLYGTMVPGQAVSAIAGLLNGFRLNGVDANIGTLANGPHPFGEVWAKTDDPTRVNRIELRKAAPFAKINGADSIDVAWRDQASGEVFGPVNLPWVSAWSSYGGEFDGAGAYMASRVGMPLDFYYQENAPTPPPPPSGGAQYFGFGTDAGVTGGLGGQVLRVTNGNSSGAGSLRWAIEQAGKRIVVFDVNVVNLTADIVANNSAWRDLTLYGQTAGGVEVRGASFQPKVPNLIIQGMSFAVRKPVTSVPGVTAFSLGNDTIGTQDKALIAFCTIKWGNNELFSLWRFCSNITIQNCLLYQPLLEATNFTKVKGAPFIQHGSDGRNADGVSFIRNLILGAEARTPWVKGGSKVEFINNMWYGPMTVDGRYVMVGSSTTGDSQAPIVTRVNLEDNIWLDQPDAPTPSKLVHLRNSPNVGGSVYVSPGNRFLQANGSPRTTQLFDPADPSFNTGTTVTPAFTRSNTPLIAVDDLEAYLIANCGMRHTDRYADDVDIIAKLIARQKVNADTPADTWGGGAWVARPTFVPYPESATKPGVPAAFEGLYADVHEYAAALIGSPLPRSGAA